LTPLSLVGYWNGKHVVLNLDSFYTSSVSLWFCVVFRGLAADYRLINFIATVSDRPGGIGRLTTLLGNVGASIKDMYHERAFLHSNIDHVKVKVSSFWSPFLLQLGCIHFTLLARSSVWLNCKERSMLSY
jgi:hypothetical protein